MIVLAIAVVAAPASFLAHAGVVRDADGKAVIPSIALYIGCMALFLCILTSAESLRHRDIRLTGKAQTEHASVRVGSVLLGLISVAWFGAVYRFLLQIAAAHRFFMQHLTSTGASTAAVTYWGLTLLALGTVGFIAPLIVVAANMWPRTLTPSRLRVRLRALSRRRWAFVLPVVAAAAIVLITQITPSNVQGALGYTAPGSGGDRDAVSILIIDRTVWSSFARLAFLILAVGMWEGTEIARACHVTGGGARVKALKVRLTTSTVHTLGWCTYAGALLYAAVQGEWWLIIGGLALAVIISLAIAGAPIVAMPSIRSLGTRLAMSEEVRSTAPIGLILIVLAGPVLGPLVFDLWNGLAAPFRFPSDADGYVHYWSSYGIAHVPGVSIAGIFGHGARLIALAAVAVLIMIAVGIVVNGIGDRSMRDDVKPILSFTVRVGLVAVLVLPVIDGADRSSTPFIVAACALPVVLLSEKIVGLKAPALEYLGAVLLLGLFAAVASHLTWLPSYGILAATILWSFFLHAKDLNTGDVNVRIERGAWTLSIACLGAGLLALDHGAQAGVFSTIDISTVTDGIGIAVIAPIMLIALIIKQTVGADEQAPASANAPLETGQIPLGRSK